jgi:hypothetical protein
VPLRLVKELDGDADTLAQSGGHDDVYGRREAFAGVLREKGATKTRRETTTVYRATRRGDDGAACPATT